MDRKAHRRTLLLFGALSVYILLQSLWWAYLLVRKDRELEGLIAAFELRPDGVADARATRTLWMVLGEGSVFLLLLLAALVLTYRAIRRDLELARAQRNFLLAVTHELRTPIASAKLHLQTLGRAGLSADQRGPLVQQALHDMERLAQLTDKVLSATRSEDTAMPLDIQEMDVMPMVHELIRGSRERGGGRTVTVNGPEHMVIPVDPVAFRSIIENLLENAAKYAPYDTAIEVEVSSQNGHCEVRVLDEGPGVPVAERERIFQLFHRGGDEEVRETEGTGLGLYIARRLARRMGGDVCHRTRAGKGSIFAASFPLRS